jgi:hypothetical protein
VPEALQFKPVFNEPRWADISNSVMFLRVRKKYRDNYNGVINGGRSEKNLKYDGNGKERNREEKGRKMKCNEDKDK